jgi:flagellar hook-length control protein FliK
MQADFCGFQLPFADSGYAGPSARSESAASKPGIGANGSQNAASKGFLGVMARLLGKPLQGGSCEPGAERTAPVPGDPADADHSDRDALLLQAATEIGLDPEYLKNLVAAAEAPTGPEQWQSLQTLLETLSLKLQQSEQRMPFSRLQAFSTILNRIAELVSSKLANSDSLPATPAGTTGAVDLPASPGTVPAGFMQQLKELLATVRSASGSSRELEQAAAVKNETARPDTVGPQNRSQSSDTPDSRPALEQAGSVKAATVRSDATGPQDFPQSSGTPNSRPADAASRGADPGNTLSQNQMIQTHAKSWLQTQAESLGGSAAGNTDSETEGHAVLTRTAGKQGDDSATRGSKHPLPAFTATGNQSLSAGLNAEQKATLVADPASGQDRPEIGDAKLADEDAKLKIADLKESEGIGWSQSAGDRSAESALTARVDPQAREALQSEALQQIIQKASVHLRNGENEVKIELKPEFMGHIRMQIVTENHQVTLRVLTEFPMVKDLIEHNIQHLRAELQQHGLKMDVVNVSVANDSQTSAGGQWRTPRGKAGFRVGRAASGEQQPADDSSAVTPAATRRSGNSAIDYFI